MPVPATVLTMPVVRFSSRMALLSRSAMNSTFNWAVKRQPARVEELGGQGRAIHVAGGPVAREDLDDARVGADVVDLDC